MIKEQKVLALKYRPQKFEDLVGQSTISQTLSLALDSNRLSHAYLFSGLRGSGKTSTARIMAKALICQNGPTSKPCDTCESCLSANANKHLDIIEMDAASNRGIDDIKDLIEHTKYKPSSARFKVFIIDEVHMLTTQAFNALLKTLEEPPGFVKFILATTDPLKLPATILSRTQHFRFKKIAHKDVMHHLSHILNEENVEFETSALEILSRSGQGSLRDTLTLLDQAIIFAKGKVTTTAVTDMLGLIDPAFMDKIFDVILKKGDITQVLLDLEDYEAGQICDEMTIYLKEKMLQRDPRFDLLIFDRFFRVIADGKYLLSLNSDSGFVLILTLNKMIEATNLKTIADIIEEVEKIKTKEVERIAKPIVEQVPVPVQETLAPVAESNPSKNIVESNQVSNVEINTKDSPTLGNIPSIPENITESAMENEVEQPIVNIQTQAPLPNAIAAQIETPMTSSIPNDSLSPSPLINLDDLITGDNQERLIEVQSTEISDVIPVVNPILTVPPMDKYELTYKTLIDKVYDRSHDLGLCFEKNFIYKKYEDSKLYITSYALDDERKLLYKNFALIRSFVEEIFGLECEIEFEKGEKKKLEAPLINEVNAPIITSAPAPVQTPPIEEEIPVPLTEQLESGSGCVPGMSQMTNPNPAQRETQIEDILNSSMLNRAKELFDVRKITVKSKT